MRLETLGFGDVADYVAGKMDWVAAGLPFQGTAADEPHGGDMARTDAPTATIDEIAGDVQRRVRQAGWNYAIVLDEARIVLGLLQTEDAMLNPKKTVGEQMAPGPSTIRVSIPLSELKDYLAKGQDKVIVTTQAGEYRGVVQRADLEAEESQG